MALDIYGVERMKDQNYGFSRNIGNDQPQHTVVFGIISSSLSFELKILLGKFIVTKTQDKPAFILPNLVYRRMFDRLRPYK
jgi:hypothetical protein